MTLSGYHLNDFVKNMVVKECKACGVSKELHEFPKAATNKYGVHSYCKPCYNAKRKAGYKKGGFVYSKDKQLWARYKNGKCDICNIDLTDHSDKSKNNRVVVDHCHTTDKVRGLLCNACNSGIGYFFDKVENIFKAAAYVSKHKEFDSE